MGRLKSRLSCLGLITGCGFLYVQNVAAQQQNQVFKHQPVTQEKIGQTEKQLLSGTGNDNTVNWDFYCTAGRNSGKWTTIAVPSNWELQGFGKYDYGFSKDSLRGKEQGLYKRHFTVAPEWKGKKINLVFEGVMTDAAVKINGKPAGVTHQGSFYSFKYDISKMISYGKENLVEVTVSKHSANASVNEAERKADFWLFGGIFRPVFLEALPAVHIERISLDAKADGSLAGRATITGKADQLSLALFDASGRQIGNTFQQAIPAGAATVNFKTQFTDVKLWSAEYPELYTAKISLFKKGQMVHAVQKKTGFRTIVVKARDGMYVNGAKIKFKGVNRHSFWPTSGRTTSKKLSIEDVLLMKDMNMNAVRMSHYPPDEHFLDVCDSLGLFVMDELAGWHGTYDTPTGLKLVKEMIAHDENHASIVFWANGNEGGHNLDLDASFGEQDLQQRPVIHPWQVFSGFDTQHYREYNYGIGNYDQGHNIVMPTEFLHGMYDGGHGSGLEDYWKAMWLNPLSAGGFLWDFADQGVVRTDKNGEIDTDGNHAADGIVGPFHQKEGSYFAIKEIWSPVYVEHREITPAFDGSFTLENRYSFTNLKDCHFSWKLSHLGGGKDLSAALPASGVNSLGVDSGKAVAPVIEPLAKGKLQLTLPGNWAKYDVLALTVTDPHNRQIFTWTFPIVKPAAVAAAIVKKVGAAKVELIENGGEFQVNVKGLQLNINKKTGILTKVQQQKVLVPFNNGPVLQEGENNFAGFTGRKVGDSVVIASVFDKKTAYNTLKWVIYPSGWVKMEMHYFPGAYFTNFVGVNFSFPEQQLKSVQYMGNGPYRVWKNRMKGNQFGVWKKDYNDVATGETPFAYPEFKGYHSTIYWAQFNTNAQPFTVVTDQEDMFLRLFTPKVSDDPYHNLQATFPTGDISFMQGISGIGTKTQKPETTGPMGMKNIYYDYEKEPVRAKVLTLFFDFSGNLIERGAAN